MSQLLESLLTPQERQECAANDAVMAEIDSRFAAAHYQDGRDLIQPPGEFSEAWARNEKRYWRAYCRNAGECYSCGEMGGRHESDCKEQPEGDES